MGHLVHPLPQGNAGAPEPASPVQGQGNTSGGLSLDQEVEADEVARFAQGLGVTYPLYRIGEEAVAKIFGEEVFIPLSILIDEKGQVVDVFEGWSPQSQQRIHQLLE